MKNIVILWMVISFLPGANGQSMEHILETYRIGQMDSTVLLGQEFLKTDPGNTEINLLVGRALADQGKFKESISFLLKAGTEKKKNWVKAWSLGYLGMCSYMTGESDQAKRNLDDCILLKATSNSTHFAEKRLIRFQMMDPFLSWETTESAHFVFHFQDRKAVNVKEFMAEHEEAFAAINTFFNATLPKKIDFYVWNKREDGLKILGRPLGYSDTEICLVNAAKDQTTGHEITHVLAAQGIHPVKKSKLINEGLATYFDKTFRDRMKDAKQSLKTDSLDVIDLWNNPQKYPDELNYTVGGALIAVLYKKGEESLKALIKNQTVEAARAIYPDFEMMMKEFQRQLLSK